MSIFCFLKAFRIIQNLHYIFFYISFILKYLLGVLVVSKVSTSTPLDLITFSELFPLGKQSELTIFAPHSPKQAVSGLVAMPHLSRWKNRGKHAARIPKSLAGP